MSGAALSSLGALEHSAQRLLERAREQVQAGQALDVMHVALAALAAPGDDATDPLPALAAMRAGGIDVATFDTLLRVELRVNAQPASAADGISDELRASAALWRQRAAERNLRVTDTLVLWAIMADENAVSQRVRALNGDRAAMLQVLESQLLPVVPETLASDWRKMGQRVVPASLAAADALAYAEAATLTWIAVPTPELRFKRMHAVLMANLLNVLGSAETPDIVLLEGRNGTPLDSASLVLAERLVSGEVFTDQRARLNQYHRVNRLSLESVRRLAHIPDKPAPQDVLQMAMQQAVEDQAILVLEHMEALERDNPVDAGLLAQLANGGDALVLGLFEQPEREDVPVDAALGLENIRQVPAREYSVTQTQALLREYYIPQWETQGFTFSEDAFDSVIKLEPGAWIELKRKTLPYLAVGLGRDAMQTVKEGRALVLDTARMALDALNELRQEWATTEERVREQFADVLAEARRDIEGLIANPDIRMENGRRVITRAHVVAQLICPNDSEFHYPGHAPKQLRRHSADDLPLLSFRRDSRVS
jgi:hypothetical protein